MTDRQARKVEVSTIGAPDETERGGSEHPPSATFRIAAARGDTGLHVVLTQRRSDIVERFVRTFREENVARPDASRAAVIDDLVFFLADLADALRDSIPPTSDRARRHGNRRHLLGFDLAAVLREYSVLRSSILGVARDAQIVPSPEELSLLDRSIDNAMSDAALAYAEQRDAEVRAERAALEAERARLADAVASRDDVLAIVSHDLRNPLTSIALGVDQLRRHEDPARRARVLDSIERSTQRMTTLIEDLLAIAKIDAGQLALNFTAADASVVLDDALTVLTPLAEAKSIQLSASVPHDTILRCDRDRLLQVFGNLLGNALKFTPENGEIRVEARISQSFVRFVVSDTGPGIPSESLPYVFDRFYQGPGRRRGGAGLGLAIARAIVEAHGGSITVESDVGAGTRFQFTVPLADGQRRSTI